MRVAALALSLLALTSSCRRKHVPVDRATELPYPTCDGGAPTDVTRVERAMRAAPDALEPDVSERFTLAERGCLRVLASRQDWHMNVSEVEVVYDARGIPLRAWKRMTIPGDPRGARGADIRRYELRTPEVVITRRAPGGARTFELLRGERPTVVIAPGRGVLTAWIQRAHLAPGERVREVALDMRELLERIRPVTLRRESDMDHPGIGRRVRVYTVYGRETVFTDDDDVVIGDLGGMRPAERVPGPAPSPLPTPEPPDPERTP
ncbi:MAG: hypothetical protein U0325_01350 [Polyangiales bacterium]